MLTKTDPVILTHEQIIGDFGREIERLRAENDRLDQEVLDRIAEQNRLRAALHEHHATTQDEVVCHACKKVRGF